MSDMKIEALPAAREAIRGEIKKAIQGQDEAIDHLLIALFSGGHILMEGVPGLGKSLLAQALGCALKAQWKRIQFTPDLMPSDIVGTTVYDADAKAFRVKKGPVFTNVLLADEINRAPAKTQSALLEAMQEGKANIDGVDYPLPKPFIVIATQNPIEMEGTYPLPEAQIDRFMMKITLPYPGHEAEKALLGAYCSGFDARNLEKAGLKAVADPARVVKVTDELSRVKCDAPIIDYIVRLAEASRRHGDVQLGASPRASVDLLKAARASAALDGRDYVVPDDVRSMLRPVFRHRISLRPEAEIEGRESDGVLTDILASEEVPR
jgi:MoxR-like ATPase